MTNVIALFPAKKKRTCLVVEIASRMMVHHALVMALFFGHRS